jgi:hypothetical protein
MFKTGTVDNGNLNLMTPEQWGKGTVRNRPVRLDPADHDTQVALLLRQGFHVEVQTKEFTQLLKGNPVNHVMHILLTILTAGGWLPIYLICCLARGERRKMIARDVKSDK